MNRLYATGLSLALLCAAVLTAPAQTIRRVNNSGATGANLYATAQAAHDAAVPGDVIHLEQSSNDYGALTCTKNVRIVGPGYFLDRTPGLQANTATARLGNLNFDPGSDGASITGVTVNGAISVAASNIRIERNRVDGGIYLGGSLSTAMYNTYIRQNYVSGIVKINSGAQCYDILIANNLVYNGGVTLQSNVSGEYRHNVIVNGSSALLKDFVVQNNYFTGSNVFTNCTVSHNLSSGNSLPAGNNNQLNVPATAVFELTPGAVYDAHYQLKSGPNPARGTGTGGSDIGAFGGAAPYVLSGIPAVPSIYEYNHVLSGTQLQVTLSTRANN
ncbi:hypothetical protein [Hymenobacter sp. B81]|uniref:hypothetical protein n=1 Tax=Hymenobacter sp. B81 TaxID=3344878 RepID=UPI0037DDAA7A